MDNRKYVISQALTILIGELVLSVPVIGIFALLGYFDWKVVLGALVGTLIATANHFIMVLGIVAATEKATASQDVKGGQMLVQMSYMGRLIGLFLVLVICAKSNAFNLIALVIPLILTRPILTIAEHFNKKGGNEA